MSTLIHFDVTDPRAPSPTLCIGIPEWQDGAVAAQAGILADFDDYVLYNSGNITQEPSEVTHASNVAVSNALGVITVFEAAGSNEDANINRNVWVKPSEWDDVVFGARVHLVSDADSPQLFVMLTDTAAGSLLSSGALAVSSNQDGIGLRWNADETVDIVKVLDGAAVAVLVDDIGCDIERTDGFIEFGLKIKNLGGESYRLTPVIDGAEFTGVNVDDGAFPEVAMQLAVAATVAATTDVDFDVDWTLILAR